MANYVYYNGIIVESGATFGGGGGAGGVVEYRLDGVPTEVTEDTVTPANTRPLPVKMTNAVLEYNLDGVATQVAEDTLIPANTKSLPVKITNTTIPIAVKDFLDVGLFDASVTNIPASTLDATQVVATLAAAVTKIQIIEDIGEFMALYSDAARTNLLCFLPLGGGEVEVSIGAGSSIFIGHLKGTNIVSGNIAINFLG